MSKSCPSNRIASLWKAEQKSAGMPAMRESNSATAVSPISCSCDAVAQSLISRHHNAVQRSCKQVIFPRVHHPASKASRMNSVRRPRLGMTRKPLTTVEMINDKFDINLQSLNINP